MPATMPPSTDGTNAPARNQVPDVGNVRSAVDTEPRGLCRSMFHAGAKSMSCRRVAGAFWCVLGLTPGFADAQAPAPAAAQPLNPTQEIARETPDGPPLVAGQTEIRIGGYLGVTGIYRSTNGGGG